MSRKKIALETPQRVKTSKKREKEIARFRVSALQKLKKKELEAIVVSKKWGRKKNGERTSRLHVQGRIRFNK
jgi:hypothetical protein